MVLKLNVKIPVKDVKISRVVLISGLLTFLYSVEFCIGIRTVYYTFKLWSEVTYTSHDRPVSWTLCLGCLFIATVSVFSINVLSAMWEQKQLEEKEKEKSATRFAFHIIVGGIIWRYITLWWIDTKEFEKRGALLLTMIKFLFTQTFTVPLVIVHVSVLDHLEEVVYDTFSVFCISANLILTCTMFSLCSKEAEDLRKWDFQTVDLVPLIFRSKIPTDNEQTDKNCNYPKDNESQPKREKRNERKNKNVELVVVKIIVFFQTFGFSLGRLLALGILLKLAGIYAVSIMFLQLLVSVIYLKFQASFLVSDSLPKWRQLSRLAFMSYILIFEWHLNRNPKTGYDFSSNRKHSILYYCVATIESVFYLVTWTVATSYALKSEESDFNQTQNKFCRNILVMGSMALVFSLTIHIVLLFWRSRKVNVFFSSVRSQCEAARLSLCRYKCGKDEPEQNQTSPKRSKIDISSPIPIKRNEDKIFDQDKCDLEKHNSYRDLREPLDDEIEICFRKCDKENKSESRSKTDSDRPVTQTDKTGELYATGGKGSLEILDTQLDQETNNLEKNNSPEKKYQPATIEVTESNESIDKERSNAKEKHSESSLKSKITVLSGNISQQLGKVSCVSKKVADSMKEQIQKRKEQFQNFRNCSVSDTNDTETGPKPETSLKTSRISKEWNNTPSDSNKNSEPSEGYFVGDSRGYQGESLQSVKSTSGKHTVTFSDEIMTESDERRQTDDGPFPASDVTHKNGDSPCLCYVCKTLGEGRFRRRRSSSAPSVDQKSIAENSESKNMPRYASSPVILRNGSEVVKNEQLSKDKSKFHSPKRHPKTNFDFSRLSRENSVEHYV